MIELERTYLAKELPLGIENCRHKEIIDVYYPLGARHPTLRLRKNGDKYEMTKKERLDPNDASKQEEHTISLTKEEFENLRKAPGKEVQKVRYYYDYKGRTAEIDIFEGDLKGLVVIDFEFDSEKEKDEFEMPEFCLADVTQDDFIAGGMLCGKKYEDIEKELKRYGYYKIEVN